MQTLETDLAELQFLISKIESAEKTDREALYYRQDERAFRLLADFDTLAGQISELPEASAQKKSITLLLSELDTNTASALFKRIDDIKQRIAKYNLLLTELGGARYIAAQAYIRSMETIRIEYYDVLAKHIASRLCWACRQKHFVTNWSRGFTCTQRH